MPCSVPSRLTASGSTPSPRSRSRARRTEWRLSARDEVEPGRIAVEGGALTGRLGDDDETVVRYAGLRGRLLAAAARLARKSTVRPEIRPVVVIWGDFPPRAVDDGGVAYVHGDELDAWLRLGPAVYALAS